jgi:hypothetical protein
MKTLLPVHVEAELILAPEAVQRTFDRVNLFLAWACGVMKIRPTDDALSTVFWRTFREEGGTDADFEWLRSAGLADERDRQMWAAIV